MLSVQCVVKELHRAGSHLGSVVEVEGCLGDTWLHRWEDQEEDLLSDYLVVDTMVSRRSMYATSILQRQLAMLEVHRQEQELGQQDVERSSYDEEEPRLPRA